MTHVERHAARTDEDPVFGADELQAEFARAISSDSAVAEVPKSVNFAARAGTGGPRLTASEQLEIYREQFWLRHHGALAEDYPALQRWLGDESFARAVARHVAGEGLSHENLTWFGRDFERAVAQLSLEPRVVRVAVELTRLEWHEVESFHAASVGRLGPSAFGALGPDDFATLGFDFAPAMRLVRFEHAVTELRRWLWGDAESFDVVERHADGVVGLWIDRPTFVVVHRPKWTVHSYEASEAEFSLLEALLGGKSLVDAVEAVSDALGDDAWTRELGAWFEAWGSRGFVVALRTRT